MKCEIFFTGFNQIWGLLTVSQRPPVSNFLEIRTVGAALLHADRWTDTTKVMGAFSVHADAHEKGKKNDSYCWLYTAFKVFVYLCLGRMISVSRCVLCKKLEILA